MGRIPSGWKKVSDTTEIECYKRKNYSIYIWKIKKPESQFVVEPFRTLANYNRRLFKKEFRKSDDARKWEWSLMKQKEIRAFYSSE